MAGAGRRGIAAAFAWSALFIGLAFGTGAFAPARAQDDPFTARAVAVDATAENAAAARVKALAEGQRRALRLVFERVCLAEDWPRLPRVNDRVADGLVQALEVDKERTSTVRYLAELTFHFKAEDIRALLREAGVRFAETRSRPIVVLPVLRVGADASLWEDANPWLRAWAALPLGDGLVPLIVPIGDLTDADAVDAQGALGGDAAKLAQLAQRYRAAEAIVATATLAPGRAGQQTLQIATARYVIGASQPIEPVAPPQAADAPVAFAAAQLDDRLAGAARDLARRVEEQWKRDNLISFDQQQQRLTLSLPLERLSDLVEARRRLAELASVRRVEVTAMTRRMARLSLTYTGEPQQLRAAVAQKDMVLAPDPPDWRLTLGSGAAPAPAAAAAPAAPAPAAPPVVAAPQ